MLKFKFAKLFPFHLWTAILLALGISAITSAAQTISTGDLDLPDVRGGTFHLADHHPRLTLVAFLALVPDTTSTPSLRETVFLSSMEHQYAARGLCVIAIDTSQIQNHGYISRQEIVNASADWHIDFPVLDDSGGRLWRHFVASDSPTLFLIDGSGKVIRSWRGYTRPAILAQAIESVLGGPLSQLPKLNDTGK